MFNIVRLPDLLKSAWLLDLVAVEASVAHVLWVDLYPDWTAIGGRYISFIKQKLLYLN